MVNWIRPSLSPAIQFRHVHSNTDNKGPAESGNRRADQLANKFRLLGKDSVPIPDLIGEEPFYVEVNGSIVQKDIRMWAKEAEKSCLARWWSEKCPVQSKWMRRNSIQILTEEVWKWSIDSRR